MAALVVFVALSWWISQKDKTLTLGQKERLLGVIKSYMTQKVLEKEPNAKDILFADLHTEPVNASKTLKAHFKFSYLQTDAQGRQNKVHRKGHFLVTSADGLQWKAQIDEVGDVKVEFVDALEINTSEPLPDETSSDNSVPPELTSEDSP